MTIYRIEIRDVIVSYLEAEFPECSINEQQSEDSYCFRVIKENNSYFLRVMYTAIISEQPNDVVELLEQYAPANTMRGLGDFPVVVTEQGCMFGSP